MFLPPIPYEYLILLDPGDRVRKANQLTTGRRVRRLPSSTLRGTR